MGSFQKAFQRGVSESDEGNDELQETEEKMFGEKVWKASLNKSLKNIFSEDN